MARIALCSGTTTGPCVAVLEEDGTYDVPSGHFIAPDNSGDIGDTWGGSSWSRVSDPGADSVQAAEWRADGDTDELQAVIGGVIHGMFDSSGRWIVGHTASVAAGAAALAQVHREGADPGFAIIGYGATATSFPSLVLGRSKGTRGAHGTVDGSHVLGRVSVVGATAGSLWQETSRLEWTRDSGGTVEGGDALASTLSLKMQIAGAASLAEVMRWTHTRRVGINVAPDATLHVNALDEGDVGLRISSQGNPVLNVLGDGTTLLGNLDRPDLGDGTAPLLNVAATGGAARGLFARFAADALGPSLVLAKSRSTSAAWTTGTLAGDEVGSIDWRGADGSGAVDVARITGLSAEADAAAGALVFEVLLSGDAALSEVARLSEDGYFGINVDAPTARLHVAEPAASPTAIVTAAIFEAEYDDGDPMTVDELDPGFGVQLKLCRRDANGVVDASYLRTKFVEYTTGFFGDNLQLWTRRDTSMVQGLEVAGTQLLYSSSATAAAPAIAFLGDTDTGIFRAAANILGIATGGVDRARFADTYFRPTTDNALALGGASNRWTTVFAATGTINTSDSREKVDLGQTPLGLDFIEALTPRWFRWADGSRRHAGVYAQDVAAALTAAGIDPATAGMWTLADPADPDSRQGLRMDQLISPLIRAVQQLSARVAALEAT